jgi:hypothetical protein
MRKSNIKSRWAWRAIKREASGKYIHVTFPSGNTMTRVKLHNLYDIRYENYQKLNKWCRWN